MKGTLVIALTILKLSVEGIPSASAETRLEQLPTPDSLEQVREDASKQQVPNTSSQALEHSQQQPTLIHETTSAKTQLSERDRLIQERFLIKIIPAQNQ